MPESKTDFRAALSALTEARGRESDRRVGGKHQHLLLGAITKRPN